MHVLFYIVTHLENFNNFRRSGNLCIDHLEGHGAYVKLGDNN